MTTAQATAIFTRLPGHNPEGAMSALVDAKAKLADAQERLELARQAIVREGYGEDLVRYDKYLASGKDVRYIGSNAPRAADRTGLLTWQREVQKKANDIQELERAAKMPAKPAQILVTVINSYAIKDSLKARGYRFDPAAYWHDPVGMRTSAGWTRTVGLTEAEAEMRWLREAGVTLSLNNPLNTISEEIRHK